MSRLGAILSILIHYVYIGALRVSGWVMVAAPIVTQLVSCDYNALLHYQWVAPVHECGVSSVVYDTRTRACAKPCNYREEIIITAYI